MNDPFDDWLRAQQEREEQYRRDHAGLQRGLLWATCITLGVGGVLALGVALYVYVR